MHKRGACINGGCKIYENHIVWCLYFYVILMYHKYFHGIIMHHNPYFLFWFLFSLSSILACKLFLITCMLGMLMIYLQLLWYFVLQIIVETLYEQLAVRLCLTASSTIAFTGKEQRMWGRGIAKTMLITLSGHINLVVLTLRYVLCYWVGLTL